MENDHPSPGGLEPREPTVQDLALICQELNRLGARYIVVGGFAMRAAGFIRQTMDIDLIVDCEPANEALVYQALEVLPDKAVRDLCSGDLDQYHVIRVADEVVVDLMKSAGGVDYAGALADVVTHDIADVRIPFASPKLLWKMKSITHREKDDLDMLFLKNWLKMKGEIPPTIP